MSISPLSMMSPAPQPVSPSSGQQDFLALANALQSGNLQGAQKAYASLEALQGSAGATAASSTNPIATDFAALGQALSSGDLSQAQTAFKQLQTAIQATQQSGSSSGTTATHGHRHHRHHGGGGSAPTSTTESPTASSSSTTTGGTVDLLG
jgi:hypothetical protein